MLLVRVQRAGGREESTIMRSARRFLLVFVVLTVVGGFGGVAGAATVGPVDVSLGTPLPTDAGVQLAPGVGVAVPDGPQVGVDTSVGVSPTEGVDAKIDVSAGGESVHVGGSVPLSGAPPQVDISLPSPDSAPVPGVDDPGGATGDGARRAPEGSATAGDTRTSEGAPAALDGRDSVRATRPSRDDVLVDPDEVSASIEPARRGGMWSSLGHAAARFGPWFLLLALGALVNLIAKAAARDQHALSRPQPTLCRSSAARA
jgi:hypothetical protein